MRWFIDWWDGKWLFFSTPIQEISRVLRLSSITLISTMAIVERRKVIKSDEWKWKSTSEKVRNTDFTLRDRKQEKKCRSACIDSNFTPSPPFTLVVISITTNFTRIFLKIEFQLTMLINIASADNLFITELCQWLESQFSNPRAAYVTAVLDKVPEIKPSTTDEDAECSRNKENSLTHFTDAYIQIEFFYFSSREKLIDNFSPHSIIMNFLTHILWIAFLVVASLQFSDVSSSWITFYLMPSHSRWITHDEFFSHSYTKLCIIRWWKFKKSTVRRNCNRRWKEERFFTWNLTFSVYQSIAHDLTLFTLIPTFSAAHRQIGAGRCCELIIIE